MLFCLQERPREEVGYLGEVQDLVPNSHPNPLLGLAGSGENSIGKVLEGEVGVRSN